MSAISFYDTSAWRRVRREVLRLDNNECQECKIRHRHTKAVVVHHTYHLDEYPEFGLSMWVDDPETGERKRNLVSVCRECHETVCHPERLHDAAPAPPLTEERW